MQNLQSFHTFHIQSNAREIIEAHSIEQLQQVWAHSKSENLPTLFLGQGSNVLFLDDFNGIVILNRLMGITHEQDANFHYLHVNGGGKWHKIVGGAI
ncbi:FAD-binding protein, partial [Haemophilus influenzae]|uniref:FAD-binding protein n=1 Tax=Haemophilus influenzae TaxID=727 RepID=UPI0011B26E81